jgi:hypothetical protein
MLHADYCLPELHRVCFRLMHTTVPGSTDALCSPSKGCHLLTLRTETLNSRQDMQFRSYRQHQA